MSTWNTNTHIIPTRIERHGDRVSHQLHPTLRSYIYVSVYVTATTNEEALRHTPTFHPLHSTDPSTFYICSTFTVTYPILFYPIPHHSTLHNTTVNAYDGKPLFCRVNQLTQAYTYTYGHKGFQSNIYIVSKRFISFAQGTLKY